MTEKAALTRPLLVFCAVCLAISQASCLKTRSQVRSEQSPDEESEPLPSEPGAGTRGSRYELEEIKSEIIRVSGKLEELEHLQKSQQKINKDSLDAQIAQFEARLTELEKNQLLILSELKELKDKGKTVEKPSAPVSKDLISEGFDLLKAQKYEEAAEKFKAFLAREPRGKEAADAYFGLGEAEYGLRAYKRAIVAYSKVQEVFLKSQHIPTSLFRIGRSFQKLNMDKEAKGFFNELLERYPKSPEAKKVRTQTKAH